MESSLVDRGLAEKTQGDLIGFLVLAGKRYACCQGNLTADNRVTAEKDGVKPPM